MALTQSSPVLVVAAVIQRDFDLDKKILIVQRGSGQSGAGFWEFPGGKVELGESPEQALIREIDEELGISIRVGELIDEMQYTYPSKTIRLRVYWASTSENHIELREHEALKWCWPHEVNAMELSAADRPFLDRIQGSK